MLSYRPIIGIRTNVTFFHKMSYVDYVILYHIFHQHAKELTFSRNIVAVNEKIMLVVGADVNET